MDKVRQHPVSQLPVESNIEHAVFNSIVDGIIVIDRKGTIHRINPAVSEIFGYEERELLGRNVSMLMPSPHREVHDSYIENHIATGISKIIGIGREVEGVHKDGEQFPLDLAISTTRIGAEQYFIGMVRDISERNETEKLLKTSNRVMRAVNSALGSFINTGSSRKETFDAMLESLLDITESSYGFIGEILHKDNMPYLKSHAITNIAWSRETRKLYKDNITKGLEFHNLDTLFGVTLRTGDPVISNDPAHDPRRGGLPTGHPDMNAYMGVPIYSGNKLLGMAGVANREGGYNEELHTLIRPLLNAIGTVIAGYQDMAAKKRAEDELYRARQQLKQLATTDPLTGIPNRYMLLQALESAFKKYHDGHMSLLFVDIDHFKKVNDTHGHAIGDELLRHVVNTLRNTLRPSDIFGRYGGEEFLIGLPGGDLAGAHDAAVRCLEQLRKNSFTDSKGNTHRISCSIGIATRSDATINMMGLIEQADQAVYRAKNEGRNCVRP